MGSDLPLNNLTLCSFQQWVASVDIFPNEDADANIVLNATESWIEQEKEVSLREHLNSQYLKYYIIITQLKLFMTD